jgi:hypothetical protein
MATPMIKIDGIEYEIPQSINLGEARIVERYCEGHSGTDNYGIAQTAGLIHVAIRRRQPNVAYEEIQQAVDNLDLEELIALLAPEGDAGPPGEAPKPSDDAAPLRPTSEDATGDSLENGSPSPTGLPVSPTGSGSFREISVS